MAHVLASLALNGIVERSGPRKAVLRVTPRFLAHAEGTAGRLRLQAPAASQDEVLEAALLSWDGFGHDARLAAQVLARMIDDHWGMPLFGTLDPFAAASA